MPLCYWRKFSGQSMVGIIVGFWAQRPESRCYPLGERWVREWRGSNLELSSAHEGLLKARQEDSQARFNARGRSRVFTMPRQTHWIFRGRRSYTKLELEKKQLLRRAHFFRLGVESCQASILILNGQCNHLHYELPGVKPNSTPEFTTHFKMRVKETREHKKAVGKLQESNGESQN